MNRSFSLLACLAGLALLLTAACDKSDPAGAGTETGASVESDAAECMAGALGENTGGLMDQAADLVALAGGGFQGLAKADGSGPAFTEGVQDAVYDPVTGTWTATFERTYGTASSVPYAHISRTYTVRFLNAEGRPQIAYVSLTGDTAASILLNVVSGTGRHVTARLSQKLNAVSASYVAAGTHTPTVTLTGSHLRAATDTLTSLRAVRTLDYVFTLASLSLTGPRGNRRTFVQNASGTLSGRFTGRVTFQNDTLYAERNIDRTVDITLSGGQASITINGKTFEADLPDGQLDE